MFYVVKILGIQFAYIISRGQKVKGFPHFTELALLTNSLCRHVLFAFWETWYILNNINTFGNWRHQRNSKFARILFCLFKKREWYLETKNVNVWKNMFCNMWVWFEHHFSVREFATGSKNFFFLLTRADLSVCPPARLQWKSGHLNTGIYASWIIKFIKPTRWPNGIPQTPL